MRLTSALIAGLSLLATPVFARPFTADDLVSLNRLSSPAVSKDGRMAAFVLRETDLAANKGRYDVFLLDLTKRGAQPTRFQAHEANDQSPTFAPDGKTIYFLSGRSGSDQVWKAPVAGGAAVQVTNIPTDVVGFSLSPTGNRLAFWAEMYTDCPDLACTAKRNAEKKAETGRAYDQLFVRHWDTWKNGQRSRLFTVALDSNGVAAGAPVAVSGSLDGDTPSKPQGEGDEIAWSPDGSKLFFALREAGRTEPWSTNLDIFEVSADGSGKPVNLTAGRLGMDLLPTVSPDGRTLAWASMARGGYEADRQVVWLRDLATGQVRELTGKWDRSVSTLAWTQDGKALLAAARDTGQMPVFRIDAKTGAVAKLTGAGAASAAVPLRDGGALVVQENLAAPADLFRMNAKGQLTRLTNVNAEKLADVEMGKPEQFSFAGANGDTVYGFVVKPPQLKAGEKAPIAFLIHGGPQSSFNNAFSYRWNPNAYTGAGYAVVMIDFHGSQGYGQAFTDAINKDWGGKPLEDLQKGLAASVAKYDWLDGSKACALGGSYGGFMVNWIAGHWPDGFKCLVNHAGIFDQRSMYYGTEELWFPEWDFGGPYFAVPDSYERWNPASAVTSWKTPMLVIHGEKDFRVPYTQGVATFTALQRRDVPSRLVMFPDEHHWILKPANSLQWHREAIGWLDKWLKP